MGGNFIDSEPTSHFNIIATDTTIVFDYSIAPHPTTWTPSPSLALPPTIHNGIAIDLESGPAFANVTINPATNMLGFDDTHVSFTAGQIQVDWGGLSYDLDTIVVLDVVVVPQPVGAILPALVLGVLSRRRRS